ncbi:hypothetical protein pEaSNUABM37_00094 [Erwinia phage pEa_SNUABM_37]|nr:hypothetical protein pEaSNUABM37_00094 [Erwinia phage pEa_SNUABM_37]QXO10564.1 hypothetical protein pEaSNUABM48_00094 [Erwinia phage pEa_SNUABM_48]
MFFVISLFAVCIGYVAFKLSATFRHRTLWFFILSGLLAFVAGLLFKALFLV